MLSYFNVMIWHMRVSELFGVSACVWRGRRPAAPPCAAVASGDVIESLRVKRKALTRPACCERRGGKDTTEVLSLTTRPAAPCRAAPCRAVRPCEGYLTPTLGCATVPQALSDCKTRAD